MHTFLWLRRLKPHRKTKNKKCVCVCESLSCAQLSVTPWTAAHQAPPSMGFPRQGYWSELPFTSPGDLRYPGIKPGSPALQADSLPTELFLFPEAYMRKASCHKGFFWFLLQDTQLLSLWESYINSPKHNFLMYHIEIIIAIFQHLLQDSRDSTWRVRRAFPRCLPFLWERGKWNPQELNGVENIWNHHCGRWRVEFT